jgi:hypothetical protein
MSPSAIGVRGEMSPLLVGGGEILDGRRCNLGIYLRKMKLFNWFKKCRFFRLKFGSSQREIEEIQVSQNATKLEPTDNAIANTEYTCRC